MADENPTYKPKPPTTQHARNVMNEVKDRSVKDQAATKDYIKRQVAREKDQPNRINQAIRHAVFTGVQITENRQDAQKKLKAREGFIRGLEKSVPSFKRGGVVRETGIAKLHKGERVLTRKQASGRGGGKR